jgi:GAF domain-containing protein
MRLMPKEGVETGGRFEPGRAAPPKLLSVSGYGGIVLERLARQTCRIAAVNWSCLFVRDRVDPRLVIAAAGHGVGFDVIGSRFGADEGIVGKVLMSAAPVVVDDFRRLAAALELEDEYPHPGAAVPIRVRDAVAGVLCVAAKRAPRRFGDSDLALLADLSELAAAAIEHGGFHEHFEATIQAHVQSLAAAMDMRDRRTASHSEDVAALARRVGELMQLEEAAQLELEFAARLHDVGKIRVPDAILNKPGPLDDEESQTIRCHSTWGSDTLARIPGLEAVATIVRFHHERWDGRGYPDGLCGARIPLASRIIAICDAYGAMTTDRPYRQAIPHDTALEEIRSARGAQFDPAVVDVFVDVVAGEASDYH